MERGVLSSGPGGWRAGAGWLSQAGAGSAPVVWECLVERFPFRFREALQDHLLGGLRRATAGVVG